MPVLSQFARKLGFTSIAARGEHQSSSKIISLLERHPEYPLGHRYLVSSDLNWPSSDIVTLHDFSHDRKLPKVQSPSKLGLQLILKDARGNAQHTARWLAEARILAKNCKLSNYQFVISSGAENMFELVPGPALDAILRLCGLEPMEHWRELNSWLESKMGDRVTV